LLLPVILGTATAHPQLPIKKGWAVSRARAALTQEGWKPVETYSTLADGTRTSRTGAAGELYRQGFHEVEDCSEGLVYCAFNYAKSGECLRLITQGEPHESWLPSISNWTFECPNKR